MAEEYYNEFTGEYEGGDAADDDFYYNEFTGGYNSYVPVKYDPDDQSDAETERLLRQNSDAAGQELIEQAKTNPSLWSYLTNAAQKYGGDALNYAKRMIMTDGKIDFAKLATGAVAISALTGGNKPKSNAYQGSIPNLSAVRQQINYNDPNRRPGSAGRQYFTDTQFVDPSKVGEAQTAASTQAQGILAGYKPATAPVAGPYANEGIFKIDYESIPALNSGNVTGGKAQGGIAKGRYLQGSTDGMADKIPSSIDGKQKAALSHGEFVVPADVVSHLGNGNSDAGAKKLYEMMARVRKARTGNPKQGKRIDPNRFMPGGQVGYAAGGIAKFVEGGSAGTTGTGTGVTKTTIPDQGTSVAEGLSTFAGPYVTNMLGKGQALSNQPYEAYTGPLTAGSSPLQQQAFSQASTLKLPSSIGQAAATAGSIANKAQGMTYSPTQFTNQFSAPSAYETGQFNSDTFGADQAKQYMNPYLQSALNPQLEEARRQSQITQLGNQAKATQAGVYGGGRQAVMDAETQRTLASNLANITGQGYNTAYTNAMSQFNADQARKLQNQQFGEQSRQFGAGQAMTAAQQAAQFGLSGQKETEASKQFGSNYGLESLNAALRGAQAQGQLGSTQSQAGLANLTALGNLGTTQREIEQQGITADKTQFEEARDNPYKQIQFQRSLLTGLPITTTDTSQMQSQIGDISSKISGLLAIYDQLARLGVTKPN